MRENDGLPMLYSELLRRLSPFDIHQVGWFTFKEGSGVYLGYRSGAVRRREPYPVLLDGDNPQLHPEIIKAIARRFFGRDDLPPAEVKL